MKNNVLLVIFLLSLGYISYAQNGSKKALFSEKSISEAGNANVLLVDTLSEKNIFQKDYRGYKIVPSDDKKKKVVPSDTVTALKSKYTLSTSSNIVGYGNGMIVNYKGTTYLLTSLSRLNNVKNKGRIIKGVDGSDIAVMSFNKLFKGYPELENNDIKSGEGSFSYFYLSGITWKYRTVSGELFDSETTGFSFRGDMLMRVDESLYHSLAGSAGSVLFSDSGEIIGVVSRKISATDNESYYVSFVSCSKITKGIDSYLENK